VRECFEDEVSVTGELLAVGGQRDHSVRLARQRGAVGVLATANVILGSRSASERGSIAAMARRPATKTTRAIRCAACHRASGRACCRPRLRFRRTIGMLVNNMLLTNIWRLACGRDDGGCWA
jgi:hypothetical protein